MTQYDTTNRGILSRNERKAKDSHPEYTGTLNVDGTEFYIDAWVKERRDGSGRFFSLSVKRKNKNQAPAPAPRAPAPAPRQSSGSNDFENDPPF